MARAAMAGALHDVGAAVPVRAVVGVVPVRAWTEEQLPPDEEGWPNVEGELHRARCAWRRHRLQREQIVFDRKHVLARHLRPPLALDRAVAKAEIWSLSSVQT